MGRAARGELQLPPAMAPALRPEVKPENAAEYAVAVLRILSRKDEGEPFTPEEREACRLACRLLGKDWR